MRRGPATRHRMRSNAACSTRRRSPRKMTIHPTSKTSRFGPNQRTMVHSERRPNRSRSKKRMSTALAAGYAQMNKPNARPMVRVALVLPASVCRLLSPRP